MPTVTIGSNTGNSGESDDTKLWELNPTTNYVSDTTFSVHKFGSGDHVNGLIWFDVSVLPAGATVTAVSLFIKVNDGGSTNVISAYRALRSIVLGEATWNIWSTGNSWASGGGEGSGTDRAASESGNGSMSGLSVGDLIEISGGGMVADVQDWLDGAATNNGWHLERSDGTNDGSFQGFKSSQAADGDKPYLEVTYTDGPTISAVTGTPGGADTIQDGGSMAIEGLVM